MFFLKYFAIVIIAVAIEGQEYHDSAIDLINDINEVVLAKKSKTCVIFVCDEHVQFVATELESKKLLKELGVRLEKVEIFRELYEASNPVDIVSKLDNLRSQSKAFVVYFSEDPNSKIANSALPENIINQIKDIIQVQKSKSFVIWVQNGEIRFVSTEEDSDKSFTKFNINPKEYDTVWVMLDLRNPSKVIDKLNEHRQKRPTFVIHFKQVELSSVQLPTQQQAVPLPAKISNSPLPENIINQIKDIIQVQKSKNFVIWVQNGEVRFVSTEEDSDKSFTKFNINPKEYDTVWVMLDLRNPSNVIEKLNEHRQKRPTFVIHFKQVELSSVQSPTQQQAVPLPAKISNSPLPENIINQIRDIIQVQKSKSFIIWVQNGEVRFVTTEEDSDKSFTKFNINPKEYDSVWVMLDLRNPSNVIEKLNEHRQKRPTFVIHFKQVELSSVQPPTQQQAVPLPAKISNSPLPQNIINQIKDIIQVQKSKHFIIWVQNGEVRFVSTEEDSDKSFTKFNINPKEYDTVWVMLDLRNPANVIEKLNEHRQKRPTFVIHFKQVELSSVQSPTQQQAVPLPAKISNSPLPENITNQIRDIIEVQKSKSFVIWVQNGEVRFVSTENDSDKSFTKFNINPKEYETVWVMLDLRNPSNVIEKLNEHRQKQPTFVIHFKQVELSTVQPPTQQQAVPLPGKVSNSPLPEKIIKQIKDIIQVQKSKSFVIWVQNGEVRFVSTEEDSDKSFTKFNINPKEYETVWVMLDLRNPSTVIDKLNEHRQKRSTFVIHFKQVESSSVQPPTQQQAVPLPGKVSNSPLPEKIINQIRDIIEVQKSKSFVIWVQNGEVRFVSTEEDSDKSFTKFNINPTEYDTVRVMLDLSNPSNVIDKLNEHRLKRPTFVIYFKEVKPTMQTTRVGLLVPEYLLYDIDDLLLVKKIKTIVIFVSNGKVKFASTESDSSNKIAQLGFSPDKLQVIRETFETFNSFDILRKLSKLRYDSDTFLVHFTEIPGAQFPEFTTLINDISNVLLVKKSKSCVILVYDGRIQFVTTEEELAQKQQQLAIKTNGIEIIKETFVPKNPFDILGKLSEMRNTRNAFLVYFIEGTPAQSTGYIFPEQLINSINDILLAKKSKTVAIYVVDGKIEFVSTEPEASGKLAELSAPGNLQTIRDTYQPLDPFDVLGKLNKYLSKNNSFLIIFTEASGAQLPEISILVDKISTVVLQQNSKTCVIYVSNGQLIFISTESEAPNKIAEFNVPTRTVETIRETFERRNPFDIIGKLIKLRTTRSTFLVYFTEGVSRPPVIQVTGSQKPTGLQPPRFELPNFRLPGYQYLYPGFQGYGYGYYVYPQFQYPQVQHSGYMTVEKTKSNGGLFGMMEKFTGLKVGKKGVIPQFLDVMGLKHKRKEVKRINYRG